MSAGVTRCSLCSCRATGVIVDNELYDDDLATITDEPVTLDRPGSSSVGMMVCGRHFAEAEDSGYSVEHFDGSFDEWLIQQAEDIASCSHGDWLRTMGRTDG